MADEEAVKTDETILTTPTGPAPTALLAPPVTTPVKAEKKAVKFFFPKNARKSYRTPSVAVKAENHVYILDPKNPKYGDILTYLREHAGNNANGGRVFVELSADIGGETNRGILLDKLIDMDIDQLRKVCGGSLELGVIHSKGQLIDLYLKQQEE